MGKKEKKKIQLSHGGFQIFIDFELIINISAPLWLCEQRLNGSDSAQLGLYNDQLTTMRVWLMNAIYLSSYDLLLHHPLKTNLNYNTQETEPCLQLNWDKVTARVITNGVYLISARD